MGTNARFSFTEPELKCLLFAVSKIKPQDHFQQTYTFAYQSFYTFFPNQKAPHAALKNTLMALYKKSWWREIAPGVERPVQFFQELTFHNTSNTVTFRFDEIVMSQYLLPYSRRSTQFLISYLYAFAQMKCQYSLSLCIRLMKYFPGDRPITQVVEIQELKHLLACQQYENYNDFVKRVLAPVLKDINQYMLFHVDYETKAQGKKVTHLVFHITPKDAFWESRPFDLCNEIFTLLE